MTEFEESDAEVGDAVLHATECGPPDGEVVVLLH